MNTNHLKSFVQVTKNINVTKTLPLLRPPGIAFPLNEQKQFGSLHVTGLQGKALLGSLWASHRLSSDPSKEKLSVSTLLLKTKTSLQN